MTSLHGRRATMIALAALGVTAGTASAAPQPAKPITIRFAAMNGDTPVTCTTPITNLGTTRAAAALADLRFYISNVSLVRKDGTSVRLKLAKRDAYNYVQPGNPLGNRVTLIDLENGRGSCTEGDAKINAVIRGTVPAGTYVGAKMTMGVPFTLNHSDIPAAPAPLDVTAMAWSWQSGRKFAKIEVTDPAGPTGTWTSKLFAVHIGSTGCIGNPAQGATVNCTARNRMAIKLAKFNPATQMVAVDVGTLLARNNVTTNVAGAPGCMSGGTDPECAGVFDAMQVDWKADGTGTGQPVHEGMHQMVFMAVKR